MQCKCSKVCFSQFIYKHKTGMIKFFQKTTLLPFPLRIFLIIRHLKVVGFRCLHPANYASPNFKSWYSVLFNKEKGKIIHKQIISQGERHRQYGCRGKWQQFKRVLKKDNQSSPALAQDNKNGKIFNYKPLKSTTPDHSLQTSQPYFYGISDVGASPQAFVSGIFQIKFQNGVTIFQTRKQPKIWRSGGLKPQKCTSFYILLSYFAQKLIWGWTYLQFFVILG